MNDIILQCPHCGKDITKSDFQNSKHSWANVEKFLDQQKQEMLNKVELEVKETLTIDFAKEKEIEVLKTENKYQEIIDKLNNEIQKNKMEFDNSVVNAKKDFDLKASEILNRNQQEINNYKSRIAEGEMKLQQIKEERELLIANKANEIEKEYTDKINQYKLELATLQNNQETLILKKEAQFRDEIKPVIDQLKELVQTREIELINKQNEFEIKLASVQQEVEKRYQTQIEELKIANAQNKILQSKRKGENFEHEVEGELRKAFGMYDSISKINNTTADKKADYLQVIKNSQGNEIGKIVYEVKNAIWSEAWEGKLATDVANNKTKYGILIATSFNDKYNGIPFIRSEKYPNIWITDSESFIFVGQIVRKLIEVENDFELKTQKLTGEVSDDLIKEYEEKKVKLDEYWTIEFPKTWKIIETELKAIDSVRSSLDNNSAKLTKASTRLSSQFKDKIYKGLSGILGAINLEEE
ncbi:DUF2130 domain-containing protein [[Acholeplasma] multilocale]|uniref:DUF2130 domain-containing protein n=1 Tax=[Acholeplasma] multilocale TaxID=264638 RepID=UPI00047C017F|nr:DUF2130 domain-containing protein [[Acholeplasma] multilocale]